MCGVTLTGDYHHDDANQPIFRTDYINRDRYKFRGLWNYKDLLRLGAFFQETHADDDIVEIGYSTKVREFVADVEVTLLKNMLTLRGSGGEFLADRQILIRVPQDFDIVPTYQREFGHNWEGGAPLPVGQLLPRRRLPLDEQHRVHPIHGGPRPHPGRVLLHAEHGCRLRVAQRQVQRAVAFDQAGPLANYNANRYYVGLHWRP